MKLLPCTMWSKDLELVHEVCILTIVDWRKSEPPPRTAQVVHCTTQGSAIFTANDVNDTSGSCLVKWS